MNSVDDLIFFWIPKNAGTSMVRSLGVEDYHKSEWPDDLVDKHFTSGRVSFGHYYIPDLVKHNVISLEYYNRAKKIYIKRNPYDRAVSLWKFYWHRLSFEEFLENTQTNRVHPGLFNVNKDLYSMCADQVDWIRDNGKFIDCEVISFENINSDLEKITGIRNLVHANRNDAYRGTTEYKTFYTDKTKALVEKIYKNDLEYFNEYKF